VHEAIGLGGGGLLGGAGRSVFVAARLLPAGACCVKTGAALTDAAGKCTWGEGDSSAAAAAAGAGANLLALPLESGATAIALEAWEMTGGALLGRGEVLLGRATLRPADVLTKQGHQWFNLGGGGGGGGGGRRLACSLHLIEGRRCSLHFQRAAGGGGAGGALARQQLRRATLARGRARVVVTVQRARKLRNVQLFGTQDPYVVAYLVPEVLEGALGARQRTCAVQSGGESPAWSAEEHGSELRLPLPPPPEEGGGEEGAPGAGGGVLAGKPPRSFRLMVEVWNENLVLDDKIGAADLPLPTELNRPGETKFYHLDTGGDIGLTVALADR